MTRGPALVIGLGRSGAALARALHDDGFAVMVVDRADTPALREQATALPPGVDVRLGGYDSSAVDAAVMVCPSPGVPWDAPELERARRRGIPVRSEIDLVFERCRGRVVGITGTNGKTTTTSLVASILARGGERVHLGGNIGMPMLDRLGAVADGDWVVLELSSFQLETVDEPRCAIACVLNVTPDHLDRHAGFDAYAAVKARVVRFASDAVVLGYDDSVTRAMAAVARAPVRFFGRDIDGHSGVTVSGGDVVSLEQGGATRVLPVAGIPLFGAHNVLNVLAAVAMARVAGVAPASIAAAVRDFTPVRHRLQIVLERDGVTWVNDSKATNPESAVMALRSFVDRPIVWIGGGKGVGTSSDLLVEEVTQRARHAVLNGESGPELGRALQQRGFEAQTLVTSLHDAVARAREIAQPGDVVLFAPGYKSFDQFRDFEERGDAFTVLAQDAGGAVRRRS